MNYAHASYKLRIESIAYAFGGANEASKGARRVVYEIYGSDHLEKHKVTRRSPGLIEDADLILVMEDKLGEGLPAEKVFNFNEFFGLTGDVPNPWPDDEDEAAMLRYRDCVRHIRDVIDSRADRIIEYLSAHDAT
jgi:hypothetical protein